MREMHFQADRIEMVLASHRVAARVTGGQVLPRLVRYQVSTPLGVRVKQVAGLAEELALSLGVPACRVYRQDGQLQVEVPRLTGEVVRLVDVCRRLVDGGRGVIPAATAVLGLDSDGVPVLLRLASANVAHVLIAGTTGSGKTALARSMVVSLAMFNSQRTLQVVVVDPKGRGLTALGALPHMMVPVVRGTDEAKELLIRVVGEMERRDAEGRCEPRLVVVLDELADLVQVGGQAMEELVQRLVQRGREAGVHVVACTQKPTAAVIGGLVKSNFPVRLVGSVASPEDAKVATGLAGTGAERLQGEGDFLVVVKAQVTRLQAAYIGVEETQRLAAEMGRGQRPWLPAGSTEVAELGNRSGKRPRRTVRDYLRAPRARSL